MQTDFYEPSSPVREEKLLMDGDYAQVMKLNDPRLLDFEAKYKNEFGNIWGQSRVFFVRKKPIEVKTETIFVENTSIILEKK
jgi:hypothetical protein